MPRTAVAYSNLVPNTELADPAGTAITSGAGNGAQINATSGARSVPELTIVRLANASGSTGTATVLAGTTAGTSFVASGQGNYTTTNILTATSRWIGPFESSRFMQQDGSIIIETTQNMTATAFRVPRNT